MSVNHRWLVASTGAVSLVVVSGISAVTAASASSQSAASAAETCELRELPIPDDGIRGKASAVSPDGDYIAGTYADDHGDHSWALLWHEGEFEAIAFPDTAAVTDVNTHGDVVGTKMDPSAPGSTAHANIAGELFEIPIEAGSASSVNDDAVVVGSLDTASGSMPYTWSPGDAEVEELPLPDDAVGGEAASITADGSTVGWYTDNNNVDHAYMWNSEHGDMDLPLPDDAGDANTHARAIDQGWAYGNVAGMSTTVRWDLAGEVSVDYVDIERSRDVDAQGNIVGASDGDAVVVGDDGTVTLPGLDGSAEANAVSSDGSVVAGQAVKDTRALPTQWICG